MKFQVTQAFSVTTNGRRTEYKLGQRISETAYRRLNARHQARFLPANRCGKNAWTGAEYAALAAAYVNNAGDRPAIIAEFRQQFSTHTNNAVDMMAQQCRQLDTNIQTAEGLDHPAVGLVLALQDIDNERFAEMDFDAKFDALLAVIRA